MDATKRIIPVLEYLRSEGFLTICVFPNDNYWLVLYVMDAKTSDLKTLKVCRHPQDVWGQFKQYFHHF